MRAGTGDRIEGSKHTGKDNHAWYRFDIRHKGRPILYGRDQNEVVPSRHTGVCEQCGRSYEPQRSSSRFCSPTCRQRAHRNGLSVTPSVTPAPSESGWERLSALDGTHHGEYSALMRRRG